MKKSGEITCLFVDIGGVLLIDGWDHNARQRATKYFKLELKEMEKRHRLTFETFEEGRLTIGEYLDLVVFYQKRPFTQARFRSFMFAQSKAFPAMIQLVSRIRLQHGLKIAAVSNEAYELNAHRIKKFKRYEFVDFFISSCFVHLRKPDRDIFRLALNIAQVQPRQVIYLENTPMFAAIAEGMGIRSILHTGYRSTCDKLASLGLQNYK